MKKIENLAIFDEVIWHTKCAIFGPPCSLGVDFIAWQGELMQEEVLTPFTRMLPTS